MSRLTQGKTYIERHALLSHGSSMQCPAGPAIGDGRSDTTRSGWIMFIGPQAEHRPEMIDALRELGLTFAIAESFHEAKRVLGAQPPSLLVTHVRLGEYNGLQLVLRGKMIRPGMAAIVVTDRPDPVLERDVAEMDATLLLSTAGRQEWLAAARRVMAVT